MGKTIKKHPKAPTTPANSINWQAVARDLYNRGLISRAALGASSPLDRSTRRDDDN